MHAHTDARNVFIAQRRYRRRPCQDVSERSLRGDDVGGGGGDGVGSGDSGDVEHAKTG